MAQLTPLVLPSTAWAGVDINIFDVVAHSASPISGAGQFQKYSGSAWTGQFRLPPMKADSATAREWMAFLTAIRGKGNPFYLPVPTPMATPRGSVGGTPQTRGINATGAVTLATGGWPASQTGVLKKGDMIEVRPNLVTAPADFTDPAWAFNQSTVGPADAQSDPDGGTTAERVTPDGGATNAWVREQLTTFPDGVTVGGQDFNWLAWLAAASGTPGLNLHITDQAGTRRANPGITLSTTMQGFSASATMDAADTEVWVWVGGFASWVLAEGAIDMWGAALDTPQNARLHMVTDAADSDANGLSTVSIWPPLREDPGAFSRIITTAPQGRFRLASNNRGWSLGLADLMTTGISVVEDLS